MAFGKKIYGTSDEPQADPDVWFKGHNEDRLHRGQWCFLKPPTQKVMIAP